MERSVYWLRHTAICMRIILSHGDVNIFNLAKDAGKTRDLQGRYWWPATWRKPQASPRLRSRTTAPHGRSLRAHRVPWRDALANSSRGSNTGRKQVLAAARSTPSARGRQCVFPARTCTAGHPSSHKASIECEAEVAGQCRSDLPTEGAILTRSFSWLSAICSFLPDVVCLSAEGATWPPSHSHRAKARSNPLSLTEVSDRLSIMYRLICTRCPRHNREGAIPRVLYLQEEGAPCPWRSARQRERYPDPQRECSSGRAA